jgi:hypothetical protein
MAPNSAATAYELAWGDGTVPTWMVGNTLAFLLFLPLLKTLFPKSMKKNGAFLGAFELTCFIPVRSRPRPRTRVAFWCTPHHHVLDTPPLCTSVLLWQCGHHPLMTVCVPGIRSPHLNASSPIDRVRRAGTARTLYSFTVPVLATSSQLSYISVPAPSLHPIASFTHRIYAFCNAPN